MFETSLQAQFPIPMAVSISFGLAVATLLVLIVIPALLNIHERIAERLNFSGRTAGFYFKDLAQAVQIGLIIIGSELMTGKRRDGHMAFAIEALAARHLELGWATYLGATTRRASRTRFAMRWTAGDLVFSFGGIGATPDDHTRACAADAAGVALKRHDEAAAIIEGRFGDDAYPQRIHMAHLPEGATLADPESVNRIAGFSLGHVHFVPDSRRWAGQ